MCSLRASSCGRDAGLRDLALCIGRGGDLWVQFEQLGVKILLGELCEDFVVYVGVCGPLQELVEIESLGLVCLHLGDDLGLGRSEWRDFEIGVALVLVGHLPLDGNGAENRSAAVE